MNAKCCDRCGKYYRRVEQDGEELILARGTGDELRGVDLCPACYRQLWKWLKRDKSRPSMAAAETPELNGGFVFK